MRRPRQGGFLLVVVFGLMAVLSMAVASLGTTSVETLATVSHDAAQKQACYVAEAGLQDATRALRANRGWTDGFQAKPLPGSVSLTYTVTVTNNAKGAASVTAPDGTRVPPATIYVASTGTGERGIQRSVAALMTRSDIFNYALFADTSITGGGTMSVDGYDSSLGPYYPSETPLYNAPIGTNGTQDGAIRLFGNSMVDGDVHVGPAANLETAVDADGHYTGEASSQPAQSLPEITVEVDSGNSLRNPRGTIPPGTYGGLRANAQNDFTLTSGEYYFTGDVNLGAGSVLRINATNGPVKIFMDASWDSVGASIINDTQVAANLQVYGTSSCLDVKLSGGSGTCMVFYAPQARMTVQGNADLFGSLTADSITFTGNAGVHYDVQLRYMDLSPQFWQMTAYRRI